MKITFRRFILLVISLIGVLDAYAQTFGNEWIVPSQNYYKLQIADTGVFRIFHSTLENAGVLAENTSLTARRIQIFRRGVEQAIVVNDANNNGVLESGDYIEFYAEPNDGREDSELYISPEAQPHQFRSLYLDEAAYFITFQLGAVTAKRMTSFFESNVTNISADQVYSEEKVKTFTTGYHLGRRYSAGGVIKLSQFDVGEGWGNGSFSAGQQQDYIFDDLASKTSLGESPTLKYWLTGTNGNAKRITVMVGSNTNSLREIDVLEFDGYNSIEREISITSNDISTSGELIVRFSMASGGGGRAAVSYITLDYDRTFDFNDASDRLIRLKPKSSGKSYFEANVTAIPNGLLDITNKDNPVRIGFEQSGTTLRVVVDNTNISRSLYMYRTKFYQGNITRVNFSALSVSNINYLLVTSRRLRANPLAINTYVNYRESLPGGSYKVDVRNVEDLYDLFTYGDESPLAIRRYCDFMLNNADPQFLFLVGRGIALNESYSRSNPRRERHFVPTFGLPGSDTPFTAGLNGTVYEEAIPTGRLNAEESATILAYLNKVIENEASPITDLRRKRLLHLSGGRTAREQTNFKNFVDEYAGIAQDRFLGGEISNKSKATVAPVELININQEINSGVALTTFFGHSSSSAADIDVGLVSRVEDGYNNKGRYGYFLVHGCNAGNFFSNGGFSFGDDWINTPDLGIIGFMAHSDQGLSSQLRQYGDAFYEVAFAESATFGTSIGEIRKAAIRKFLSTTSTPSEIQITQAQQMVLLGDPATKLFPTSKSEYELLDQDVSITSNESQQLLSTVDSLTITMDVKNYGRFEDDSVEVSVRRVFQDGGTMDYPITKIKSVPNRELLSITVSNVELEDKTGTNVFFVTLDPNDSIDEVDKANNTARIEVFLAKGSTSNILPSNLSIIGTETVNIVTHPTDLLNSGRSIVLEFDNNPEFTSPLRFTERASPIVNKAIAIAEIAPDFQDTTVIFWRTKLADPQPEESSEWNNSSFTFIKDIAGWGQLRESQYDQLISTGLQFNNEQWSFEKIFTQIDVQTNGLDIQNQDSVFMKFAGQDIYKEVEGDSPNAGVVDCRANTLNFVVFDKKTTTVLRPILIDGQVREFDEPRKCGKAPQSIYSFTNSEMANNDANIRDLFDNISDGTLVLVFSVDSVNYDGIHPDVKVIINNLGIESMSLDDLTAGESVIFLGRTQSAAGTAIEVRGNTTNSNTRTQKVSLVTEIEGNFDEGVLESPVIGPVRSWKSLSTNITTSSGDISAVQVIGIRENAEDSLLFEQTSFDNFDLSVVDSTIFPRLRLIALLSDQENQTPAGFNWWTITYNRAPEGVLVLREDENQGRVSATESTVEEGAIVNQRFSFLNVSEVSFNDSVRVDHVLRNVTNNTARTGSLMLAPVNSGESVDFEVSINTIGINGVNNLNVKANDEGENEETFGNNTVNIDNFVEVIGDVTNPLLDVTFDGQYIFNNDIVSPTPLILMKLKDDNNILSKSNTDGINVFIKENCDECPDFERQEFDDTRLKFTAATTEEDAEIEFLPGPLENGNYTLRVLATDESGNSLGEEPFEISFEVINESMITNFYPYPNPFSTSTRFVFTLTGTTFPEDMKIQIMTISGRVVREIFLNELGNIHIGNNITDYAWDGHDQYGDQLANGVYLYRVLIKNRGENFKPFETSGDKAFKKGFGKMYLLR